MVVKNLFVTTLILILLIFPFNSAIATKNSEINDSEEKLSSNSIWIQEIGNSGGNLPGGFGVTSNVATRAMGIYDEELYIGTQNFAISSFGSLFIKILLTGTVFIYKSLYSTIFSNFPWRIINYVLPLNSVFNHGCDVWKYNNSQDKWFPIVSDTDGSFLPAGFGTRRNFASSFIIPFKEKLYMGTAGSSLVGCEIWEYDSQQFKKVVERGFGNRFNSGAWSAIVFNDELYVGTMNWKQGCQIWKTNDGQNWANVPLPGGNGFGTRWSAYLWSFGIYNNALFVGTANSNGCQLWKYYDEQWEKVALPGGDGFGEHENYGIRNIVEYNNELWFAIATNALMDSEACEIWKYDGETWTPVIGDSCEVEDGFNDLYNKYAWSMIKASDNSLWVGTASLQTFSEAYPATSKGCEIWRFNGNSWEEVVGDNRSSEIENGFGSKLNAGARSMIEYPKNSGVIWIGTLNLDLKDFKTYNGCEVWKRICEV
jgi:hypothetical protein